MIEAGEQAGILQREQDVLHRQWATIGQDIAHLEEDLRLESSMSMSTSTIHNQLQGLRLLAQDKAAALQRLSPLKTAAEQKALQLHTRLYPVPTDFLKRLNTAMQRKQQAVL